MSQLDEQADTKEAPVKSGHGGRRAGAGRNQIGTFTPLMGDLVYAKNFISQLMCDESQPLGLRARCAIAVVLRGNTESGRKRSPVASLLGAPAGAGEPS